MRYWAVRVLLTAAAATAVFAGDPPGIALRGHLRQEPGKAPVLETADHRRISLEGDEPTARVLTDARLKDSDFEVLGHSISEDRFAINGIHLPSLFVYRGGKRQQISYWCDVCYIRTSSPGKCWCCQRETALDPVEPER